MALTSRGLRSRQENGIDDFLYLGVGTGTQTATVPDVLSLTGLDTEVDRVALTKASVYGASIYFQFLLTSADGNATLTEWGIFDAASGGNLLAYGLFSPSIAKTSLLGYNLIVTDTLANG